MKFNNKIDELLGSGKITPDQATVLRNSLGTAGAFCEIPCHPKAPSTVIWTMLALMTVGLIVWGGWAAQHSQPQTIQNVSESLNQPGGVGEMNKSITMLLSILFLSLPAVIWFIATYNGLVNREEDVLAAWAQVESNYQRRSDLIPNLVKAVDTYVAHEGATLRDVTQLREQAKALQADDTKAGELAKGSVGKLEDENYLKSLSQAQKKVGDHLKTLLLQVEAYPNLRSSDQFLELQGQLEGTENRINVARLAFNERVNVFNSAIRRMPGSLLAGFGNFHRKAYFQADEGADKAKDLNFNLKPVEQK